MVLLTIAFVLTLFGGRLVQLQGMEAGTFREAAALEQIKKQTLTGVRGDIYDDTGHALAMTLQTFMVDADPAQMTAADMPEYAAKLAGPLGVASQQVLNDLQHPPGPDYVVLSQGVSATASDKVTALDIPGIYQQAQSTRVYPNGPATLNVVGFANSQQSTSGQQDATGQDDDDVITGQEGIEQQYNALLSGRDGSEVVARGTDNQQIPLEGSSITPATNGSDITLTINAALQYDAQQACEKQVKAMHARDCTVVIMQPKTGDILAMAQWPQYCTSAMSSCNPPEWQDLPVAGIFEPGSTAKVITAAAALERGGQTPMSAYNIPSSITEGGQVIHDAEWHPGERYTIAGIIANSSNIGMAQVANTISPQVQYDYLRAFGLGEPTGLDLQGESPGTLAPPSAWAPDERYTLAYGQGIDVTALQMASVYATIANGGVRVQPRIIESTTGPDGKVTQAPPSPSRRVIQAKTAHELIQILQQVPAVDESAGVPWGIISGYAIASKTGTSSETVPTCPKTNILCEYGSSYIGMAPGSDPQVVVAVNVQHPDQKYGYFGDVVAGPVFNQVMKFTVQTLQIPPDNAAVPYVRLNAP